MYILFLFYVVNGTELCLVLKMPSEARLESHQVCSFATLTPEGLGGGGARGTYKYIQMRQLEGPRSREAVVESKASYT